jgi:hypothetical protein
MITLKPLLLIILVAGGAAAQVSSTTSVAPDVNVIKISWRRVSGNPRIDQATSTSNPERGLKMAVNRSRINEANSARESGIAPSASPRLLDVPSIPDLPPTVHPWSGFIYEFTIKNTGSKTIRKLVWEYSFTDPATQKTVGRRQFKSNVKILPGAMAKLLARSSRPPIGIINAAKADQNSQDQSPDQMVIQRITYADGSVWKRNSK